MFRLRDLNMSRYDYKSLLQFLKVKVGCSGGVYDKKETIELLLNHHKNSTKINDNRRSKLLYFAQKVSEVSEVGTIRTTNKANLSAKDKIDLYFKEHKYEN